MTKPKKYLSKSDKAFKRVNPAYANKLHKKHMELSWLKEHKQNVLSTLPKRLMLNFESYDFKGIKNQEVQSVFIYGKANTGKTVLSAYLYQDFVYKTAIKRGGFKSVTYHYVIFPDFIDTMQNDFKDTDNLVKKYSQCDILVLDDFGNKKITDYVFSLVYLIVNNRYLNMLPTIINSNYSLQELGTQLEDDRIIRRIEEDYLFIEKTDYKIKK